ncbi:hypothetical protein M1L60_14190 [Actinoplanes sp. TRM 88003]|uniref:Lipoprotein n=1 Tax=Paractinoplanes aksuensis TaxID=2939490 RepID=A0ABT1DLM6_9ACTN|nr:hypothetical protein [Actinoplanes aksuensis]MCO8271743.1 hypothetical protein [Actinoplanes aksuensis]
MRYSPAAPLRRTLRTAAVLGLVSAAAACGTAMSPGGAPVASGAPAPVATAPAALRTTCEAVGQAYQKNMAPFAEALTKYVADRKTIATAQQSLASFATAVQEATAASEDADLKSAGKKAATQMHAKSTDAKFFEAIKTPKDVEKTLGTTLTGWLSPVSSRCS